MNDAVKDSPDSARFMSRLTASMHWSRLQLEPFRVNRVRAVKQYLGKHYSSSGAGEEVPLPMLKLAVGIYLRHLIPRAPRVSIVTHNPQLKPAAAGMESWINQRIMKSKIVDSLRMFALDAIFSIGILKVGLCCTGHSVEIAGQQHDYGMPYIDTIDLDDWGHDMSSKRWDQVGYMFHRYRMPKELALANPTFDKSARDQLSSGYSTTVNEFGDERIDMLSKMYRAPENELEEMVELWEVWLPRQQLIVTMSSGGAGRPNDKPLSVRPWVGPEGGPFHILKFGVVPGNTMPVSPVMDLLDMHELANELYRKLSRQAQRQMRFLGIPGHADKDGNRITKTWDGQAIRLDNPGACQEFSLGGFDERNFQFVINLRQLFSYFAGNLDTLGGLSPQAETLGQEQILQSNSSQLVKSMQEDTQAGLQSALNSLGWYYWTDPLQTYHSQVQIPNTNIHVDIPVTPQMRSMDSMNLNFEINPYSLQQNTPAQRAQQLLSFVQTILLPAAPVLAQSGMAINWPSFVAKMAELTNMQDVGDILIQSEQLAMQARMQASQGQQDPGQAGPGPQSTTRTYNRTSSPQGGQQSAENQMMQSMMTAGRAA